LVSLYWPKNVKKILTVFLTGFLAEFYQKCESKFKVIPTVCLEKHGKHFGGKIRSIGGKLEKKFKF
jgi:hypothetical protein